MDPTGSRVAGSGRKNNKTPQKSAFSSDKSPVKEKKKAKTKVKRKILEDDSESEFDVDSLVNDELKNKSKVGDNKCKSKISSSKHSKSKKKSHKHAVSDSDPENMESGNMSAKGGEFKKAKRKKRVAS